MKNKLIFLSLFLLFSFVGFSQTNSSTFNYPRNEIRVNLLTSVLGIPEINYEYFIEDNFGLGLAVQIGAEEYQDMALRAGFIPYGRLYFGEELNAGFFIEGSFGIIIEKFEKREYTYGYENPKITLVNETNLGVGVSIGYKFLTKNNWVGDISAGAGRIFGDTMFDAYPRAGISIGKRF